MKYSPALIVLCQKNLPITGGFKLQYMMTRYCVRCNSNKGRTYITFWTHIPYLMECPYDIIMAYRVEHLFPILDYLAGIDDDVVPSLLIYVC